MNNYTFNYFKKITFVISLFSSAFFMSLAYSGKEIFSNQGVYPNHQIFSPHFFPSFLFLNDSSTTIIVSAVCAGILSFLLNYERARKAVALILWYMIASFSSRNPIVQSLAFDYLGIILMILFLIPTKKESWQMPALLLTGYNFVFALAYTASGISKCFSEPWIEGSAVPMILSSGRGMNIWLTNFILSWPTTFLSLGSYTFLLIEILALPLFLFSSKTRNFYFFSILFMHFCIGVTTYITKMSVTIIFAHLLLNPIFIQKIFPVKHQMPGHPNV